MTARRATRSRGTDTGHARDYAAVALTYAKRAAADKRQVRHCKWVRLAAQRHLDDLKRQRSADWGYRFDPWHANDVCDVMEKLPHVEGQWDTPTITLEPFQVFILAVVFGWRVKATGLRRFTVVYEEVARKNAKSTKTAGISIYCLACENEPGPQVLTAATTFDQAKKVFHPAKRMVEKLPELQAAFGLTAWAKSVSCTENGGYMQPIHSKSKSQDGHNPHLVTLDELHAHSDRGLYDVMVTSPRST
jgi:phage terminase large subunit-like protein